MVVLAAGYVGAKAGKKAAKTVKENPMGTALVVGGLALVAMFALKQLPKIDDLIPSGATIKGLVPKPVVVPFLRIKDRFSIGDLRMPAGDIQAFQQDVGGFFGGVFGRPQDAIVSEDEQLYVKPVLVPRPEPRNIAADRGRRVGDVLFTPVIDIGQPDWFDPRRWW